MLILIIQSFILNCFSQANKQTNETIKNTTDLDETVSHFPGGKDAYIKYLKENMKYPEEEKAMGIDAIVQINFIVDANGNITKPEIAKPATENFNNEALRLIKTMPKWMPAKQNGKNVAATYTLPVPFSMGLMDSPDPEAVPDN